MKKLTVLLIICLLAFAGCKAEEPISESTPAPEAETLEQDELITDSNADKEGWIQMENPLKNATSKQVRDKVGVAFASADGAEEEKFFLSGEEMGEYRFSLNGNAWNARMKKTKDKEDISGLYYKWDEEVLTDAFSGKATLRTNGECVSLLYFVKDKNLMISIDTDISQKDNIIAVAEQVFKYALL